MKSLRSYFTAEKALLSLFALYRTRKAEIETNIQNIASKEHNQWYSKFYIVTGSIQCINSPLYKGKIRIYLYMSHIILV